MKKLTTVILTVLVATGAAVANEPAVALKEAGVNGALALHLGCGDGAVTATLRISDATTVQGLDRVPSNVHEARRLIQSKGLYGSVSVDHLRGRVLPYVDNLVRALVVSDAQSISRDELMRVVCPGGVAIIDGELIVKPWPEEMAQWDENRRVIWQVTRATRGFGILGENRWEPYPRAVRRRSFSRKSPRE